MKLTSILTTAIIGITMGILLSGVAAAQRTALTGREWQLTQLNGNPAGASRAFLRIDMDGRRFSGNAGCNHMSGTADIGRNSIRFSRIITTKMACRDTPGTAAEGPFLDALGRASSYRVTGKVLSIYTGRRVVLKFKARESARQEEDEAQPVADQFTLEDKKWVVESIEAKPIPKVEQEAFVVFDAAKQSAGGNTSCNVFGGSYTANGGSLKFTETISTMRACIEDQRMDIEREFLEGLRSTDRYEIRGDRLLLYHGNQLLLTFAGRKKT